MPLGDALDHSDVLRNLQRRIQESRELLQWTREVLGPELGAQVASGAFDESGWTLLAKVRQRLPQIATALQQRGRQVSAIRIRVQSARSS
jgi:prophage DNA circulation protein